MGLRVARPITDSAFYNVCRSGVYSCRVFSYSEESEWYRLAIRTLGIAQRKKFSYFPCFMREMGTTHAVQHCS
jgi:hypothetical protein